MKSYPETVKDTLYSLIHDISKHAWLYTANPARDFTRNRKLSFEKMLAILVGMGGHTMRDELMDYFGCTPNMATVPAFVQRRSKIMPEVLEFLFHQFTDACAKPSFYKGFRLLAVDGSALQFTANPSDKESYYPGTNGQLHYSLLHLNAIYDLLSRTYLDAVIQKRRVQNENKALVQMVDRSCIADPVILLADRGYESYNNLAHMERKGWNYLIRLRDSHGIMDSYSFPKEDEFDIPVHIILTRKQTNTVKQMIKKNPELYRYVSSKQPFDFLDLHDNLFYPLDFRIVRFSLPNGSFETVITNLDANGFPPEELRQLYFRRWGIETAFRQLKHTIALSNFQSKKVEHIFQEIFARLIMYNFTELITSHVIIQRNHRKYTYQANFSAAVHICRQFLRGAVSPPNVEALIARFITPIRPGRNEPRKLKPNTFKGFLYRIA